ncbi:MAG: sigma-70 family RNA polymerase sigma factor [Verrucomicrobia bacterium]|nr:sigma-70 family RNA polymerase sigma factor [Verrucomicrobiota bacterium]
MTERPDEALISDYLSGNTEALALLIERHRRCVYGYIVNMIGGGPNADDVFQDVWLSAIRHLHSYRHRNFGGWLIRIAHNAIIDRTRKKQPDAILDVEDQYGRTRTASLRSPVFDASRQYAAAELGLRIAEAVKSLPVEQREVFLLRSQESMAFKDIAELQGTSINTALARMQYALSRLRPLLQQDFEEISAH